MDALTIAALVTLGLSLVIAGITWYIDRPHDTDHAADE